MTLNTLPENMIKEIAKKLLPNQRIKPTRGTISISIPLYTGSLFLNPKSNPFLINVNAHPRFKNPRKIVNGMGPPVIAIKLDKKTDNKTRILIEDLRLAHQKKRDPEHIKAYLQPRSYLQNFLSEVYVRKNKASGNSENSVRVLAAKPLTQMSIELKHKKSYKPESHSDYNFSSINGWGRSVKYDSYDFEVVDKDAKKYQTRSKTRSQAELNRNTRTVTNFMHASKSIKNALDGANPNPRGGILKPPNGYGVNLNPRGGILKPPKGRSELDKLIQQVRGMNAWQNRLNEDYNTNKHHILLRYEDFVNEKNMKYYNNKQNEYTRGNRNSPNRLPVNEKNMRYYNNKQNEYTRKNRNNPNRLPVKSIPMTTAARRREKIEKARRIVSKPYNRMNYPKRVYPQKS